MTRSFYIAASSSPEGVSAARALASRLEGLGMRWEFDWTPHLDAPEAAWRDLAVVDVSAAVRADVFVLLTEPASVGAAIEFGARLAGWGRAWVVGSGGHELFVRHVLVRRVESVDVLLAVLAGEGV